MDPIILSGTCSTSQLPLIQLHSLTTGNQLFNFKHPPSSTATTVGGGGADGKGKQVETGLLSTMGYVETRNGEPGVVMSLGGGKEGSSHLNVWGFHKEQPVQRLIPPLRLSTISLSPSSRYLAGGTHDGRILLWDTVCGNLLLSIDAHYRTVSVLTWSSDDAVLCSGSEDAGISVWCLGSILQSTPLNPPTPYTTLTDHTLGITSILIGVGTFPHLRILTGSSDGCVKLWDLTSTPAVLLSTFAFPSPISHLAWDSLERFFFVVLPSKEGTSTGGKVLRVDLYEKAESGGMKFVGGGMGEVRNVNGDLEEEGRNEYACEHQITSLHLSSLTSHLLLGTSSTTIHILSLPSLLPIRIIQPPLSTNPHGPLTFLSILERPSELGVGVGGAGTGTGERKLMNGGMGRQVISRERKDDVVEVRIPAAVDVRTLLDFDFETPVPETTTMVSGGGEDKNKIEELQKELEEVKKQLNKAVGINEAMWKKIVEGSLENGNNSEEMEVVR